MKLKIARGKLEKYAREKFKIARGKSQKYAREAQQLPVANQQIKKFHGQKKVSRGKKKHCTVVYNKFGCLPKADLNINIETKPPLFIDHLVSFLVLI